MIDDGIKNVEAKGGACCALVELEAMASVLCAYLESGHPSFDHADCILNLLGDKLDEVRGEFSAAFEDKRKAEDDAA